MVAFLDATGQVATQVEPVVSAEADARALVSQLGLTGQVTSLGHRMANQL